jgi:hypothetical protein
LGSPHFNLLAQNLFIHWLRNHETAMLSDFLGVLGIDHDGHGCVEDFPQSVEPRKAKKAVALIYDRYPQERVEVYLNLLDSITGIEWPGLDEWMRKFRKPDLETQNA